MSFDGHVLCQRMLIGPCALTTLGAATVAAVATAAPLRNLRRVATVDEDLVGIYFLPGQRLETTFFVAFPRLTQPEWLLFRLGQVVGRDTAPHKAPIVSPPRYRLAHAAKVNNRGRKGARGSMTAATFGRRGMRVRAHPYAKVEHGGDRIRATAPIRKRDDRPIQARLIG